jgi:hypothetical protein
MASSKDLFEAKIFAAAIFGSGMYRGVGALTSTTGAFTVTGIALTRTLDLSDASINDLANLLGTLIYDIQEGIYDGSTYTLTNGSTDRAFDADATTLNELLNVLGTSITDNTGTAFVASGYTVSNHTLDWTLNCANTSLNEIADVLATVLLYWGVPTIPGLEYVLPVSRPHYTLPTSRMHWTLPTNRLHYTLPEED